MPAKPKKSESADDAVTPEVEAVADDAEVAPMNRAERRAKGKPTEKPPVVGKIQPGRTNLNHGPRSYANRRSG